MTDYSDIVPSALILERSPTDSSCAPRSWETAMLRIDEDHCVSIVTRSHYGSGDGVPVAEWHNRVLTFDIADARNGQRALDVERLRADLAEGGSLSALIDRVIAGHTVRWDGNNMRGRFTDDAAEAFEDLGYAFARGDDYVADTEVWSAENWLWGGSSTASQILHNIGLTDHATDQQVQTTAAVIQDEAERDGIVLTGSVADAVWEIIEQARDDNAECA